MKRPHLLVAIVVAALAAACSGDPVEEGGPGPLPTGPSPVVTPPPASCAPPDAPQLSVTTNDTRVTLTWNAVSGATTYVLLVSRTPGGSEELSVDTTRTSEQWIAAPPGTHYARVQAKNACGTSASSNVVTFTVTSAS